MAVEVIQVSHAPVAPVRKPVHEMHFEERIKLNFGEVLECVVELKASGNRKFEFKKYFLALER
jgi:hypothetical protein